MAFIQLVREQTTFMNAKSLLPRSQKPATGPCPEPTEFISYLHTLFVKIRLNYYIPIYCRVSPDTYFSSLPITLNVRPFLSSESRVW